MADEKKSDKTIEMRLAELEDKVAKIHITEEELKAYHKVSSLIGGAGSATEEAAQPSAIYPCITPRGIPRYRGIPRINRGINDCNECGPCMMGGGGMGGGGFGGFGM